jgi:uncharacterized protein
MRIAAIADLHCRTNSASDMQALFKDVSQHADMLVLAGDLTDNGQPNELAVLLSVLKPITLPSVAVFGNHDHEHDQAEHLAEMLDDAGIYLLDGSVYEINGIGFVGTKGFCGGFDDLFIQPFGERALKAFIQTSLDEAVRLEGALAKLVDCSHRVAVLHYAPIKATVLGEPPELYAFLGSSRLANALDRHGVDFIVHGHAHHGSPMGHTSAGIPVHNVCRFVQTKCGPHAYCIFEVGS